LSLSQARQQLLELMQEINFGRIEQLRISNREPCLEPQPRIVWEIKLGSENGCRPERDKEDFVLRKEIREFFNHLDSLQAAVIDIEVKHGVPFRLIVERGRV
jgi:hypothetical protein